MPTLDTTHTWEIKINAVDVTSHVDPGSLAMTDAEGSEVDTLYMELADPGETLEFGSWQSVQWTAYPDGGTKLEWFGGLVVSAETAALSGALGRVWRLKCEGYQTLLARAAVYKTIYINRKPGEIVIDILDRAGLVYQDRNQNDLSYLGDLFEDTGQDWSDWETISGDAAYAVVVTNTDLSTTWGYLGQASGINNRRVTVYQDIGLTEAGWNGSDPAALEPALYYVRRAFQLSAHRPLDVSGVSSGGSALPPFATNDEDTLPATLTRVAQEAGWVWRLDPEMKLYFGPASNDPAPFAVSDGENANYSTVFPAKGGSVNVNRTGMEMINQVVIHGGAKESPLVVEEFVYEAGAPTIFRLAHRNLIDITVWLNGVVVADGTIWWHQFGDYVVLTHYGEGWIWFNTLAAGDEIIVHYHYYQELLYTARDEASIERARQAFTRHVWDRSITSEERAAAAAAAILAQYGPEMVTGSFEVWRLGLRAGQEIDLTFDSYGVDGRYVIRKLDCRLDASGDGLITYVEFGAATTRLSAQVRPPEKLPDVWYGNFANLTNVAISQPQKPATADVWLAKRDTTSVDATAGGVTVLLPPAINFNGRTVRVVKVDATGNPVNVQPSAGERVNSAASTALTRRWDALILFSTGSDWIAWVTRDAETASGGGGCGGSAQDWTATFEAVDAWVTVVNGCVTEITWKQEAVSSARVTTMVAGAISGAAMQQTVYGGA